MTLVMVSSIGFTATPDTLTRATSKRRHFDMIVRHNSLKNKEQGPTVWGSTVLSTMACIALSLLIASSVAPGLAQISNDQIPAVRHRKQSTRGGALRKRLREQRLSLMPDFSGKGTPELRTVTVDGREREYFLYVPEAAPKAAPLVIMFHGGGGQARGADKASGGFARLADKYGFAVAYPNGIEKHWNDGRPGLAKHYCDDVAFISAMIESLVAEKLVDPSRVYATGISNGGFFSQYFAIKSPGKIAAIATVAATVSQDWPQGATSPVPILMLLGTADPLVPWGGGKIGGKFLRKRGEALSAQNSLRYWLARNGNGAEPLSTKVPDSNTADGCQASVQHYGATGSPNEVVLYKIQGGGHTWPLGQQYLPKAIVGPVCRDFDGNAVIWDFFKTHALSN